MKRLLLAVLVFGSTGCVTSKNNIIRSDISEQEKAAFGAKIEAQKARLNKELRGPRAILLARAATKTHLWRLERHGKTSYLFGTMHAELSWSSFPMSTRNCLTDAQTVVFEEDFSGASSNALAKSMSERVANVAVIRDAGEPALGRYKAEMSMVRPEILEKLPPPMAIALYFSLTDGLVRGESACMDCEIRADAVAQKKAIDHLENVDDRQEAFALLSRGATTATLDDFKKIFTGDPFDAYLKQMRPLYDLAVAYKTGKDDIMKLFDDAADYDALIGNRNRLWAPRIREKSERGRTLFVVGTGHMQGPAALGELLKKEGFNVTRVEACE